MSAQSIDVPGRAGRWRRRAVAVVVGATAAVLLADGLVAVPAGAAPAATRPWRPEPQEERSVPGKDFLPRSKPPAALPSWVPPAVTWPGAGMVDVAVPAVDVAAPAGDAAGVEAAAGSARAGGLRVWVGAGARSAGTPGRVRVAVLDRAAADRAGVAGLLLTVRRADGRTGAGRVSVQVDYSRFRSAFGGDWASRLRLVELPPCALSTADSPGCRSGRALPSRNNVRAGRISAEVDVADATATVLALTASASGSAGDYTATSLSASSSWSAGGSSGGFSWSYPMRSPPGLGGPEPRLALSYSSNGVDGRTASTNNQVSWVGEGWDLSPGFVERRYKSCADDVSFTPKPGDLCWETDNAFLSLGGKSVELVRDDSTGQWHPRDDDGSRVEHLTRGANGDNDGEHWRVTTVDGTQYHFGVNRLPGWVSGNPVTNSTWTTPVFGNDAGEPCHADTFASSYCNQAWRWNLDYVVDPHGTAMSYFYSKETNYYGRNLTASAATQYDRGGYLTRIDYGQRSDTMYSAAAPMRVVVTVDERCAAGVTCTTGDITAGTATNWPDVPYDQICRAGEACTNRYSPTFFTRKRLAGITTQVLSGTSYRDVDAWTLAHQFPPSGDGTAPALWLASITHSGKVGGGLALPAVTFMGVQLENRVDALEGIPPMYKWRVTDAYDESGGHVRVNYSGKECTRSALPSPDSNTKRCFPQYWTPEGALSPTLDWFHKYVAVQVLEDDQSGVAGIEQTDYEYLGGGAWHYDDNELIPTKYRSWSQWRGYSRVRVTNGAAGETRSQTEHLYFRGMDGDKLSSGTRNASVTDSEGVALADHPALAGFTRESVTYLGAGGSVLSGTINDPWISAATATHGGIRSYLVEVGKRRDRTALAAGGWRRTEEQTSFDGYGMPSQVNDLGDTATSADDRCTRTSYARNTSAWMLNYVSRTETVGVACTASASYPADVISDDRTFYDGGAFGAAPSKGDETRTEELASYSGGTPSYVQASRSTYDAYGRVLDAYDALDRKTSTAYTPASGGPVTGTTVTNALGHTGSTTLEPAWGVPAGQVDVNGKRTDLSYDPLGRLTAAWLPDRSKAGGVSPNATFSYLVQKSAPVVVTSQTVRDDGSYQPTYTFYDGRLRLRQTQTPAPDGGRVLTDTFYDSRGLAVKSNAAYWNSAAAGTTLLIVTDNTVPGQVVTVYDGAERDSAEIFLSYGTEKWRTTTSYGGDRVTVDPPAGATPATTITDARGQTTELRQYTPGSSSGGFDATGYAYTKAGQLATVTDPVGNVWRYGYDLRGRKVSEEDPDSGTTRYAYDDADQLLTTTDARAVTLAYNYDALGRKTGLYDGSTSGTQRAAWSYDTLASGAVVKGQLASATRYFNGNAYTVAVNGYDSRYRSLGTTVTVPLVEGALAGTYKINTGYTDTGLPSLVSYPAAGGMVAETIRYGYDAFGRLQTAQTGLAALLTGVSYSPYGEPLQYTFSAATGKELARTLFYEDGTRRLVRSMVDRNVSLLHLADAHYTYDPSGNMTRIADNPDGGATDTQCFGYDHLRRLTQAWTATDTCAAAPSASVVGGPAPYWQSWTYDKTGNRLTETNYDTTTGTATTSTSTYPAARSAHPHALSTVVTDVQTNSYGYDAAGNTTSRTVAGSAQTLTWDAEGHLATATESDKTTGYLYDADGNRLIRRDTDATTLYLGNTELKLSKSSGSVTATRYYELGAATAVRTSAGLWFQVADQHGTAQLAVGAADLSVSQRRYLPFGKLRGTAPTSWPGEKGFVGGTVDASTGLTHLGAREYDPDTGRFISVDPIIDTSDPQQMNGYAYANNSPITFSDSDGLLSFCDGCQYGGSGDHHYHPTKSSGGSARRHHSSPSHGNHFCDGCEYGGSGHHHYKPRPRHHGRICDGCSTLPRMKAPVRQAPKYDPYKCMMFTPGACEALHRQKSGGGQRSWAPIRRRLSHIYISGSACVGPCLNVQLQDWVFGASFTGGVVSQPHGRHRLLRPPSFGGLLAGSVGYSSARPRETDYAYGSVTGAADWVGGHGGIGKRSGNNGRYFFGGYTAGGGAALQGPPLWWGQWDPSGGQNYSHTFSDW